MRLATVGPLVVTLVLAPVVAAAQAFDGTQGLDTFSGPVISSGRILGLGGAYVAVAEGLGGAAVNPAAVAHRNRHLSRGWDWDGFLSWYVPDARELGRQDLGNDGHADVGLAGARNGQLGLSFQRDRLGAAIFGRGWTLSAPRDGLGAVQLETTEASVALGGSLPGGLLVLGASATAVSGVVRVTRPDAAPVEVRYDGSALRVGALLAPRGRPWRLGAAFDPGARAVSRGDRAAVPVATPAEFVFPSVLSLGASGWIGPNARRYNEPPPVELDRHPEWPPGPEWEETRRRPVLVAAQLDLVGPATGAVPVESALVPSAEAPASGERASVVVRAGAEWEGLPERLRARAGGYLEPSRTGASPRPHATFGLEVRVPFPWRDLQLGLAGDLAARFQNVSVSLGFWSSLGPERPRRGIAEP